ncbi:MAG: heterodisulfide reductase-related iron-sulfur binding cluster [Georgfuchsia sp.]
MNNKQFKLRAVSLVVLVLVSVFFSVSRIYGAAGVFNGPWWIAVSTYVILAVSIFAIGIGRRLWVWTSGQTKTSTQSTTAVSALRKFMGTILAQRRVLRNRWIGPFHAAMFWSGVLLFIIFSSPLVGVKLANIPELLFGVAYLGVSAGAIFIAGRLVFSTRLKRKLSNTETLARVSIALLIAATGISHFFKTYSTGILFFHYASVMTIVALIPYSRLLHIVAIPLWTLFRPDERFTFSLPFNLSHQTEAEVSGMDLPLGPRRREEFSIMSLLMFDACTQCGRCEDVCPAHGTGDDFSPAQVMKQLQLANAPSALPVDLVEMAKNENVDNCTTCGRCEVACPVGLEPLSAILELRRTAAFDGLFEAGHELVLRRVAGSGCAWDKTKSPAVELQSPVPWPTEPDGTPAEFVYWLGCSGRHDPAGQRVAATVGGLLNRAGVRWTTAGTEESCTGDSARRLGDEALFQKLAIRNIKLLEKANCKKILVSCSHCFNTFAREYPALGGELEVVHHSELLLELLKAGRLGNLTALPTKITFHDPCYLGRYNGKFEPVRELLDSIDGVQRVEMSDSREQSRCCGAGGGRVWRDDEPGARMAVNRAKQASEVGADIVVTGCTFCLTMLEDPVSKLGARTQDISEVITNSLRD